MSTNANELDAAQNKLPASLGGRIAFFLTMTISIAGIGLFVLLAVNYLIMPLDFTGTDPQEVSGVVDYTNCTSGIFLMCTVSFESGESVLLFGEQQQFVNIYNSGDSVSIHVERRGLIVRRLVATDKNNFNDR